MLLSIDSLTTVTLATKDVNLVLSLFPQLQALLNKNVPEDVVQVIKLIMLLECVNLTLLLAHQEPKDLLQSNCV